MDPLSLVVEQYTLAITKEFENIFPFIISKSKLLI